MSTFQKVGLGFIGFGLLMALPFIGWHSDAAVIFGLLVPLVFFWTGGVLLFIKPKDMSVRKNLEEYMTSVTPPPPPPKKSTPAKPRKPDVRPPWAR